MVTDEPLQPRTAYPHAVLQAALDAACAGGRAVVATVVRRKGSTPSSPGQKLALLGPDEAVGTVGGGAIEQQVLTALAARWQAGASEPTTEQYHLGPSLGMCCGGSVEIMFETFQAAHSVFVVGAGHIGSALVPLLGSLGFRVVLCDARETLEARGSELGAHAVFADFDAPEVLGALGALDRAAALVMTHDHALDQTVIEWALRQGFSFVGGVGSRAKAARTRSRLEAKNLSAADIGRVEMPLGVDIQARSPAEIAVSIAGRLISWRAT